MRREDSYISIIKAAFPDWNKPTFVMLTFSDKFEVLSIEELFEEEIQWGKLLDIRTFNNDKEIRLHRDYIGNEFHDITEINDCEFLAAGGSKYDMYDDFQFLDVDTKRSRYEENGKLKATGGGEYRFPFKPDNDTGIIIRNYVDYDDNGQAYIKMWRLKGFTNIKDYRKGE